MGESEGGLAPWPHPLGLSIWGGSLSFGCQMVWPEGQRLPSVYGPAVLVASASPGAWECSGCVV